MKLLLKGFFITFFLFAYSQEKINTHYQNSGKLKEVFYGFVNKDDTIKNGLYKIYYENDSLWQVGEFNNGLLSGFWRDYYPNGKIKQLLYFDKGNLTDSTVSYYPNGNIYQANKYQCSICGGKGHTRPTCPQIQILVETIKQNKHNAESRRSRARTRGSRRHAARAACTPAADTP